MLVKLQTADYLIYAELDKTERVTHLASKNRIPVQTCYAILHEIEARGDLQVTWGLADGGIRIPSGSREPQLKGILVRIKEEIKRSGTFWLPSSPERQVAGTLSISDGADVKLELPQSLYADIKAQVGYTHPDSLNPILGHVETDGYVMIDRCYRLDRKRSIVHGRLIAPDVVWANRILTNLPYSKMESLRFKTLTFSVEGIDNWVGISGIEVDTHSEKKRSHYII